MSTEKRESDASSEDEETVKCSTDEVSDGEAYSEQQGDKTDDTEEVPWGLDRANEVVPVPNSSSAKRPSITVSTIDYEIQIVGAEGETVTDVERVFERQFLFIADAARPADAEPSSSSTGYE